MKILLLGGALQGLAFGEALYKHRDCQVSVVSDGIDVRQSRFFEKVYRMNGLDYEETLNSIISDTHYDVIVPISDKSASFLSQKKQLIEKNYNVCCSVPDYNSLSVVENKSSFMAFCTEHDIPHPMTVKLSEDRLEVASQVTGFPALIKPDFSVGARGITRVDSLNDLIRQYPIIREKYGQCSLQEYIDNPDYYYNVMMYRDKNGDTSHHVTIKIIRMYPVKGGSSSCCRSVEKPDLVNICKNVLDKLNWVGMADFDVLQRLDTKEYKIIEINPRVPASLRAACVSGVNFPQIIINDAVGKPLPETDYQAGKILRYMGIDMLWFMKSPNRFKASPSWFRFWGKNIFYQDIIWSDRSTWYTWLIKGLQKLSHR